MKQVVLIKKIGGYATPEMVAGYLKRHGHFEGMSGNREYITYGGKGYQIITVAGKVAQVIEMPEADCRRIGACSNIKFGDF